MSVITDLIDENSSCNARIAELERAEKNDAIAYKAVLERQDELRAELAATKAQGVVMPDVNAAAKALCNRHAMICGVDADDQWKEYSQDFIADAETILANASLNAAPAQQVSAPVACSCGREYPANSYSAGFISGSGMCEECDAAMPPKDIPQMVSVPDGWKLVPVEPTREMISAAGGAITTPDDLPPVGAGGWSMNDLAFRSRYRDAISAAPAAPAADAGLVAVEWAKDAEEWGPALNEAGWLFLSELNEDPQKSALIFNNTKGPLRAAIMKYAEIVAANAKDSSHAQ